MGWARWGLGLLLGFEIECGGESRVGVGFGGLENAASMVLVPMGRSFARAARSILSQDEGEGVRGWAQGRPARCEVS